MDLIIDENGDTIKAMTVTPDKKTDTSRFVLTILKGWRGGVWAYNDEINKLVFMPATGEEKK